MTVLNVGHFGGFGHGQCPETPRRFGKQARPETPQRFCDDLQSIQLRANRPSSAFQTASQRFCVRGYAATRPSGPVFSQGACAFFAVTSIKLVRRRPGTLQNAGWLLALETVGAVPPALRGDIATGVLEPLSAFVAVCVVLVVWTLPNALAFHEARAVIRGGHKKPGL
jgi:hypothetical protein